MSKSYKNLSKLILASYILGHAGFTAALADNSELMLRTSIDKTIPSIELKSGVKITKSQQPINLSLRDTELRQVLRMLADKGGINIILDESVTGKVNLDLTNTNVNKAFEYLMTLYKLTYLQDGNSLIVTSNEKANELKLNKAKIKPIKIKYTDSNSIAKFLNANIFGLNRPGGNSSSPSVVVNPKTNEILIFGNDDDIALAQKVVDYLDTKPQMKTFNVNYYSPNDLATIICSTVFKTYSSAAGTSSGGSGSGASAGGASSGASASSGGGSSSGASGSTGGGGSSSSGSGMSTVTCSNATLTNAGGLESLDSPSFSVISDPSLNQITIYNATPEQISQTEDIIKRFDKKQPQVFIEISIIELSESGSKSLKSTISNIQGKMTSGFNTDGSVDFSYIYSGGISVPRSISQSITALVDQRKGRVLANPRILATNNQESTINISSDYVKTRKTETTVTNGISLQTITYEIADAGIKLNLTPKISPNGYVTISLVPSYTSQKEQIKLDGDIVATLLNRRDLDLTNIRIKDNQTLIVGGLLQEMDTNSNQKVPILGDIPILGTLFKSAATDKSRSELILMITPKIIQEDTPANAV